MLSNTMQSARPLARKKNLLLAFDAFGTLYQPNLPIPQAYGQAALRHGISIGADKPDEEVTAEDFVPVKDSFRRAFKQESAKNPNYGKASGLGAEKWWANVIRITFQPFLKPGQSVSQDLVSELLTRYSTRDGYHIFPDVLPFFNFLKNSSTQKTTWKWDKTVVGIITNSDSRVPSILSSLGLTVGPRRIGSSNQRAAQATVDHDISFVVLSYDVGYEKPDRRIFDAATQMLKETLVESAQSAEEQSIDDYEKLYVGDEIKKDYLGAEAAGWHAVFVDRKSGGLRDGNGDGHARGLRTVEVKVKEDGREVTRRVQMCTDMSALSGWVPEG